MYFGHIMSEILKVFVYSFAFPLGVTEMCLKIHHNCSI